MLNCIEVKEHIKDPKELCKLSQVGVDLTVDSIKQVIDITEDRMIWSLENLNGIYLDKTYINPDSYIPEIGRAHVWTPVTNS